MTLQELRAQLATERPHWTYSGPGLQDERITLMESTLLALCEELLGAMPAAVPAAPNVIVEAPRWPVVGGKCPICENVSGAKHNVDCVRNVEPEREPMSGVELPDAMIERDTIESA